MKYEDAYNKLNAIERQKISQAVYFGHENPVDGEAAYKVFDEWNRKGSEEKYSIMEEMQEELNEKIAADNPFPLEDDIYFV
jgi:hypothetical protein